MKPISSLTKVIINLCMALTVMVLVGCASSKTSSEVAADFQKFMNGPRPEFSETKLPALDLALKAVHNLESNAFDSLQALKKSEDPKLAEVFYQVENTKAKMVDDREKESGKKLTDQEKDAVLVEVYDSLSAEDRTAYINHVKSTETARGTAAQQFDNLLNVAAFAYAVNELTKVDKQALIAAAAENILNKNNPVKALDNGFKTISSLEQTKSFVATINRSADRAKKRQEELAAKANK